MNLPIGHFLQNGKYRLINVVGQGGFGITYRGVWITEVKGSLGKIATSVPISIKEYFFKDYCYRDSDLCTIKVHSETGKVLFDRFKEKLIKEARILSELHHPHIVNVLEVFEENNTAYIAMEYIDGASLKYKLENEGILSEWKALKYIRQIGKALQFVHEKNILHLDIKPSNILIDKNDNAHLIDFGVSKRYDLQEQETSTTTLTLSKGFASIEQYDGEGMQSFSPCPDIYSLGATLYSLLTGKIPVESILRATKPLPSPQELTPSLTDETNQAILKAMEILPANRYQTVEAFVNALGTPPEPVVLSKAESISSFTHAKEEDEQTELIKKPFPQEEDEQTIINKPDKTEVGKRNLISGSKKKIWIVSLIVFCALGSVSVVYKMTAEKNLVKQKSLPVNQISTLPPVENKPKHSLEEAEDQNTVALEPTTNSANDIPTLDSLSSKPTPAEFENAVPETKQPVINPATKQSAKPSIKNMSDDDKNSQKQYNILFASGKKKMEEADYSGAIKDLNEAKKIKMTEEVLLLIFECKEKAEEKAIANRRALYEEKMKLGNYTIVQKISTGKYGAIDNNANEKIPCKYITVGSAGTGRSFEREDHLYDIYNEKGELVTSGATYY